MVAEVFERYAGRLEGSAAIAAWLSERGYRTKRGKPFNPTAVLTILRNRAYVGEIYFRGRHYPAPHEPLVEPELFERAQAILAERSEDASLRRSNQSDYLLTGLVRCARCGKRYVGAAAHGNGGRYAYYVRFSRQRYGKRACDAERLPAQELDEALLERLAQVLEQEPLVREAIEEAFAELDSERPKREAELKRIERAFCPLIGRLVNRRPAGYRSHPALARLSCLGARRAIGYSVPLVSLGFPTMQKLVDAWNTRLEKDLVGFADRKSKPLVESEGTTLRAAWTIRGREQSELFGLSPDGTLRWVSGPSGDESYADFVTSDSMADFSQFAASISQTIPRRPDFVACEATVEDALSRTASLTATAGAVADLADEARLRAEGRTSLFFLKGDPGAGKTTLLRETTALQANRYLAGESSFLLFYVSAQGRELSNLRDAFSGELDDLRAAFTRDAIAALTRAGLLVPIVDGFDELLGTAGYSGAFSSLQSLLEELEGLGAVMVSARSAFYDIEFLGRSTSPANQAGISITAVGLQPWTDEQLGEYLSRDGAGRDHELTSNALARLKPDDRQLLRRPFFASQFPSFAAVAAEPDDAVDLLEHLIAAYIEREASKIVDSNGDPVLPSDGHRRLFEAAASEMWEGEARQLSGDDLRTLTELVSEEFGLGADEAAQLTTKVTSYAGFRPGLGGARTEFSFEHEVYFDYFLARALQRLLRESSIDDLALFLDRGVIPETVASTAVRVLRHSDSPRPELLRCSTGIRYENRRRNLGGLVVAYAREIHPLADTTVHSLSFVDLIAGVARFNRVRFDNCQFLGIDLRGTTFEDCEGSSSTFHGLKLDNRSRMMIRGLHPGQNVGSVYHEEPGELYAPQAVRAVLELLGAPAEAQVPEPPSYSKEAEVLIQLLHHVARAYRRTNILYQADDYLRDLFSSRFWPDLKRLLLQHRIVTEEVRSISGPRGVAYRLRVNADELLTGQTAHDLPQGPMSELWRDLRAL